MRLPSISISPRRIAQLCGLAVVGFSYLALTAGVFSVSLLLLQQRITTGFPWISAVQRHIYFTGARKIWPAQTACVSFDEELIYTPRIGTCHFDNPEFRTVQTFASDGRYTGPKPPGVGIAVVGDSYAMGWGVDDEETYGAVLQRLTGRPVFNLGVSSYGTVRELRLLDKSGLLGRVDTVILEYCDNDLEENLHFKPLSPDEAREKYERIRQTAAARKSAFGSLKYLKEGLLFTFWAPYNNLKSSVVPTEPASFASHYQPLISTLRQHDGLKDKRVLVFYINPNYRKFSAFPVGRDPQLPNPRVHRFEPRAG